VTSAGTDADVGTDAGMDSPAPMSTSRCTASPGRAGGAWSALLVAAAIAFLRTRR
jgi:hypothetical protein